MTFLEEAQIAAPLLVFLRLVAVCLGRLHKWSFRGAGLSEAVRLVFAMACASCAFVVLARGFPRTIYPLEFFFSTSLMIAFRFAPRFTAGLYADWQRQRSTSALRAIVVGAGGSGNLVVRDLLQSREARCFVVGFVDDNPGKIGTHVSGKPVLGPIRALPELIQRFRISRVLLAIPCLSPDRIREIITICASLRVSFKTIPLSCVHMEKRISAAMLQDLSAEHLLARAPVAFDDREIRALVEGKDVIVTGAGGTIGGEICRHLVRHGIARLVMVDVNENEIYLGARRLERLSPSTKIVPEVADIRDRGRLMRLGQQYRPEFVFHAAAHKHVPLMENAPEEAVKNNVFGTLNVALMADQARAERLVVISTDKAVNPTSVMGATKRIAELVVRDLAQRSDTKMTAVRFGNVLGSAGSVLPIFKEQIARGGPITLTHPDCKRYFMTVEEAVGLVLLAGLGSYGDLCVLDMGEPVKISEIATDLIMLAGYVPGKEIRIVYTGLRPGEKLHEELLTEEEEESVQVRNRIKVAKSPLPSPDLALGLQRLRAAAALGDRQALLEAIEALVPSYVRHRGRLAPVVSASAGEPQFGALMTPAIAALGGESARAS